MTRVLELIYWLLVGTMAIAAVFLYYTNGQLFIEVSVLTIELLLVNQYQQELPKNPLETFYYQEK